MKVLIKVIRHRFSVTQGEAKVICNDTSIVKFGDRIELGGEHENIKGWGSNIADVEFIKSAIRDYSEEIFEAL